MKKSQFFESQNIQVHACDNPGCTEEGMYRAPKSPQRLREYYWFCLSHIRDYNKSWDYYAGWTPEQIEAQIRLDTVWEGPTWPLGSWHVDQALRDKAQREFRDAGEYHAKSQKKSSPPRSTPSAEALDALATLDLSPPVTFLEIKTRYRELARKYHPDRTGGDKIAEEFLKTINEAYTILKTLYA